MSKATEQYFRDLQADKQPSLLESIREAAGKVWDGGKPMFDHGRTEIAAGLFSGHGHVMYMRGSESVEQGIGQIQPPEAAKQPEIEQNQGREM